jgi:hypothetical protein
MPTFKTTQRWGLAVLSVAALFVAGTANLSAQEKPQFKSANQAYRAGLAAHRAGAGERAVEALTFAANEGVLVAQLKLAEIYETGSGVEADPAKAFRIHQQVADTHAEMNPRHRMAPHIAGAFVALGDYYAIGVPALKIDADKARAADLYRHAASFFGDPRAQYKLAVVHLKGDGVSQNTQLAVNWLANAVKKKHAPSQAVLGDLLWRGRPDLSRRPSQGLALLELANRNAAGGPDAEWIGELLARAKGEAEPADAATLMQSRPNKRARALSAATQ